MNKVLETVIHTIQKTGIVRVVENCTYEFDYNLNKRWFYIYLVVVLFYCNMIIIIFIHLLYEHYLYTHSLT